jgi:heptosyltransferase-2
MKVVLMRFSSLGDVVLTTSAVENVLSSEASAEIYLLTKKRYTPLFLGDPRLRVISFETDTGSSTQVKELYRTARELRQLGIDLLIDLQGNPRSALLRAVSGSKRTVVYPKGHLERRRYVKKKSFEQPYLHTVDRYNEALQKAGLSTSTRLPKLVVAEEEKRLSEELLRRLGARAGQSLVGIHFGAKYPAKRWGDEKFAALAKELTEEMGNNVIVIPSEDDVHREELFTKGESNVFWTGELDLTELKALVSRLNVLVCNDSGVMHAAVALGVPVVAIFGPTHPCLGFYPLGEHDILLSSYEYCSPCSLHGEKRCFRDRKYCMENVSVSQVFEATTSVLANRRENVEQGRR